MGKTLEKLISYRAEGVVNSAEFSGDYTEDVRTEVINALSKEWRCDIKNEIIQELTEEEKSAIDAKIKAHKTQKDIESLKTLVLEGIFLAFVVGILVNQATDLITHYKEGQHTILITWIIVLLLGLGVCGYVLFRLASAISRVLGSKEETDANNP